MSPTRVWLIRHTEVEESMTGRCYGSLDVGLSQDGIRHADEIAGALKGVPLDAIYSSPMRRCEQLAQRLACARNCGIECIEDLREMDFGEFEGRTYEELAQQHPAIYEQWIERPTEIAIPGGEDFRAMVDRVIRTAEALRTKHAGQSIAVVTHGGVIRILIAEALRMDLANIFRIGQRMGAINRIEYFGEHATVALMNAGVLSTL